METIRSESWKQFKQMVDFDSQPKGYRIFKVKVFDGNTGELCGVEYANNDLEKADMTAVSQGYFFECCWCTKK